MKHRITVISVFNRVDSGTIPLENFSEVSSARFDKYIVVLQQSQKEADLFIKKTYPESGISVISTSLNKTNSSYVKPLLHLASIIRQIKPDIVHSHHTLAAIQTSILRLVFKFRLLVTAHNDYSHYSLFQRLGYGFSYMVTDKLVCNSENTLRNLPFLVSKKKKELIYNGVNFSQLDLALNTSSDRSGEIQVGSICRMVPFKDLQTLVKGFAYLTINLCKSNVRLVLVGDGPERNKLESLVKDLCLDEKVTFTGFLSRQNVYQELSKLDIFVVSSLWEGFCNAMVEAAAAGKAVIATDVEPLPEVIGRENALFFPAGDHQKLAYLLRELLNYPSKRADLGAKSKYFVRSRYSLQASAQNYEVVYQKLVKGS